MILAMARGAGEVAPLMLTGVVKLAPSCRSTATFPFFHLERRFMHLGFHIYDLGFQSPNSEAAKPMVYTTTLLLIVLVVVAQPRGDPRPRAPAAQIRGRRRSDGEADDGSET